MKQRLLYALNNWRLIVHLLFGTGHFGVNNHTWVPYRSIFAGPVPGRLRNPVKNFRRMRARAFSGFIPLNTAMELFPGYARKHGYTPIPASAPPQEKKAS